MKYIHKRKIKISGICEVNAKWIKLQYKDEWGDEDRVYLTHESWKKLDKPWLGDELIVEITRP